MEIFVSLSAAATDKDRYKVGGEGQTGRADLSEYTNLEKKLRINDEAAEKEKLAKKASGGDSVNKKKATKPNSDSDKSGGDDAEEDDGFGKDDDEGFGDDDSDGFESDDGDDSDAGDDSSDDSADDSADSKPKKGAGKKSKSDDEDGSDESSGDEGSDDDADDTGEDGDEELDESDLDE